MATPSRAILCNLCGGDNATVVLVDSSFPIVRCHTCSLVYVNPQPEIAVDEDVEFHRDAGSAGDRRFRRDKRRVYRSGLRELSRRCSGSRTILDIGCGFGTFLDQARDAGWRPYGLDVSHVSISYAVEQLGLPVERHDLIARNFATGSFSAVTMWNLLEHVPDPFATLEEVERILRPGGVALVRVPNMLVHQFLRQVEPALRPMLGLLGRRLPPYLGGISPPQHLYGFTPRTLRAMLYRAGFASVDIVPAVPHRSPVGHLTALVARISYVVSLHRIVISPAFIAYATADDGSLGGG